MADSAPRLSVPPLGDPAKAEKYINSLSKLINHDKVKVNRTDLNNFDLSTMQNHLRVDLGEYDVEISHNIQPETNKDFYTMLFNSIKKLQDGHTDKVVLAYIHLSDTQYGRIKASCDEYLERRQREGDQQRFTEVMAPLDSVLASIEQQVDPNSAPQVSDQLVPDTELMPEPPDQHEEDDSRPLDSH